MNFLIKLAEESRLNNSFYLELVFFKIIWFNKQNVIYFWHVK